MREEHASGTHHALGSQKLQARHQAHARRTACAAHRLPGPGEADPKGSKQGGGSRTPSVPRLQNSSSSHSSSRDTALIGPAGPPRQQEGPSPSTARSPALAGVVACASRRTMFGCASSAVSAASTGWPARMSSARPETLPHCFPARSGTAADICLYMQAFGTGGTSNRAAPQARVRLQHARSRAHHSDRPSSVRRSAPTLCLTSKARADTQGAASVRACSAPRPTSITGSGSGRAHH